MKCKDIRTVTRNESALSPAVATEAMKHVKNCETCHDLLLLEKLAPAIIKASGNRNRGISDVPSATILIGRIRSRIREMSEQRAASWELAVEAMRGWLAAFAVAAVILIAASLQWQPTLSTSDFDHDGDELINQNPDEYLISDLSDTTGQGKDNSHADK
jgi:hypothetical protein